MDGMLHVKNIKMYGFLNEFYLSVKLILFNISIYSVNILTVFSDLS